VTTWKIVWNGGLRVRELPVLDAATVGILPNGTIVKQRDRQGDWVLHERGWSLIQIGNREFLRVVDKVEAPPERAEPGSARHSDYYQVVWMGGLRVRAQPEPNAPEIGLLPIGTRICATAREGDYIKHGEGADAGWSLICFESYVFLQPCKSFSVLRYQVIWQAGLRVREAPNSRSRDVGLLPVNSYILVTNRLGLWMQHDQGWSLESQEENLFLKHRPQSPRDLFQGKLKEKKEAENGEAQSNNPPPL
jgi:hypothetical protein